MKEGSHLLIMIGRRSTECRNPQEANELIRKLEKYVEEGKPLQEQRLQKVSELAVQLYGKNYSHYTDCKKRRAPISAESESSLKKTWVNA